MSAEHEQVFRDSFAIYVESAHHSEGDVSFLRYTLAEYDTLTAALIEARAEVESELESVRRTQDHTIDALETQLAAVRTVDDVMVERASRAAHATKVPEHGIEWGYCGTRTQDEWRKAIRAALNAALSEATS